MGKQRDINGIINNFDIGVHASYKKKGEGISNAIIEYMANAKPVIATAIGGTKELVKDGKGGFLISNNNPIAFADAIEKLLINKVLRKKMGNYNYNYIINNLLIENMVDKYEELFEIVKANFTNNHK